jgi:hypothetical protein
LPKFIATYDLEKNRPDPHSIFLTKAKAKGWSAWTKTTDGLWYKLPNTTLIGTFGTLEQAVSAFKGARTAAQRASLRRVNVEKWIVTQKGRGQCESDEKELANPDAD